jgi:IS30 family transposase
LPQDVPLTEGLGHLDSRSKCNACSRRVGSWRHWRQPDSGKKKVAAMKYRQLAQEERYLIAVYLRLGLSLSAIARELGRHPSTVSREVRRNRTRYDGAYRPEKAQKYARGRLRRCRRKRRFTVEDLALVESYLKEKWSPDQIATTLKQTGQLSMSHESIYKHIRRDKLAGGKLFKHTRLMPKYGRKRYRSVDFRGILPGKRHISERPKEADDRSCIGHWEGDTVVGPGKHCLLTLVERMTGYGIIEKLAARTKAEATAAATRAIARHGKKFKTITFDNGTEFHDYALLEQRFPIECYFATPYHSWERGCNENFNGLVRQYLPKGMCLKKVTQAHCDYIAKALNTRPRKRHGYRTPEALYAAS